MKTVIRFTVLLALLTAAFAALMAEPANDSAIAMTLTIASKAIAIPLFFLIGFLYSRWKETDPAMKAYDKWVIKADKR